MGTRPQITELREMKEYKPPETKPLYHPTEEEIMDKLNEVIRSVNFIIKHLPEELKHD